MTTRREFVQKLGVGVIGAMSLPLIGSIPRISMPNPAVTELLGKRSLTAKHFDIGNGSFNGLCHIGHLHFPDGPLKNGLLKDINTTLRYNAISKVYQMVDASYEAEIGLYGDVRFYNVDHSIEFRLPNPNKVQPVPSDNVWGKLGKGLIWRNIIQDGGHQIVEARNGSLAKIFRFEKKPLSNVIEFQVVGSQGLKFFDGANEKVPAFVQTKKQFNFKGASNRLSWIRQPRAWNHRHESVDVELRFRLQDGKVLCQKIIPQSFIDKTFTESGAWLETDTTTSFYAGTGDGLLNASNAYQIFADIRVNTTHRTASLLGTDDYTFGFFSADAGNPDKYYHLYRYGCSIDTSGIPDTDEISEATFYMYVINNYAGLGADEGSLVNFMPATPNSFVAEDFSQFGTTEQASNRFPISGATGVYKSVTLNATGRGNISKTGWTNLGIRSEWDRSGTFGGTWVADSSATLHMRFADYTGTDSDPYLSVTYTSAGRRKPPVIVIY